MLSCLAALDVHYMFSYNEDQEACLCCKNLSGSDFISPGWETFVPREFIFFIIIDIRKFLQIIFLSNYRCTNTDKSTLIIYCGVRKILWREILHLKRTGQYDQTLFSSKEKRYKEINQLKHNFKRKNRKAVRMKSTHNISFKKVDGSKFLIPL